MPSTSIKGHLNTAYKAIDKIHKKGDAQSKANLLFDAKLAAEALNESIRDLAEVYSLPPSEDPIFDLRSSGGDDLDALSTPENRTSTSSSDTKPKQDIAAKAKDRLALVKKESEGEPPITPKIYKEEMLRYTRNTVQEREDDGLVRLFRGYDKRSRAEDFTGYEQVPVQLPTSFQGMPKIDSLLSLDKAIYNSGRSMARLQVDSMLRMIYSVKFMTTWYALSTEERKEYKEKYKAEHNDAQESRWLHVLNARKRLFVYYLAFGPCLLLDPVWIQENKSGRASISSSFLKLMDKVLALFGYTVQGKPVDVDSPRSVRGGKRFLQEYLKAVVSQEVRVYVKMFVDEMESYSLDDDESEDDDDQDE
jgi:hypothetical protein